MLGFHSTGNMKKHFPLIVFGALHIILFLLFYFATGRQELSSDMQYYFRLGNYMATGQLPYRSFGIEYPPLALPLLLIPRLFTGLITVYRGIFAFEMLAFDLVTLGFIAALSRKLRFSVWGSLGTATIALLAIGPIAVERFDLAPAAMTVAALYFFTGRRYGWAWFFVAIGGMMKFYPAALAPVFLLAPVRARQWRPMWAGIGIAAAVVAVIAAPCFWLGTGSFISTFTFHVDRGLQVESLYSSVLLLARNLHITSLQLISASGSINISSPLADRVASLSWVFIALAVLGVYALFWRKLAKRPESTSVLNFSLAAIMAFTVTSKILSPQYVIWIYPLVPLLAGRWRGALWGLFLLICTLTYFIFPVRYNEFVSGRTPEVIVLLGRNLLLVTMMLWLILEGQWGQPHPQNQLQNRLNE